jgi:hypothetical protein
MRCFRLSSIRLFTWFGMLLMVAAASGCFSEGKRPPPKTNLDWGRGDIDELNLLAVPVALNFNQDPGPDGFIVKIYANSSKSAKPVPIERGRFDLLMFDGLLNSADGIPPKPLHTWSFTAKELTPFEIHSMIGNGYQLEPLWGKDKPSGDKISVIARYVSPKGVRVYSAPSVISVGPR